MITANYIAEIHLLGDIWQIDRFIHHIPIHILDTPTLSSTSINLTSYNQYDQYNIDHMLHFCGVMPCGWRMGFGYLQIVKGRIQVWLKVW